MRESQYKVLCAHTLKWKHANTLWAHACTQSVLACFHCVSSSVPGFHGDLRAEYSGIETSTGSTQAIWGVVVLKRCLQLKFSIYIILFLWPTRTAHKIKRQATETQSAQILDFPWNFESRGSKRLPAFSVWTCVIPVNRSLEIHLICLCFSLNFVQPDV